MFYSYRVPVAKTQIAVESYKPQHIVEIRTPLAKILSIENGGY